MDRVFITNIHIDNVRHLKDIDIPVSGENGTMKHLILTGKNGSGKTSLLEALRVYLNSVSTTSDPYEAEKNLKTDLTTIKQQQEQGVDPNEISDTQRRIEFYEERIEKSKCGLDLKFNQNGYALKTLFENGQYILAYFDAHRVFHADEPGSIEKIKIKKSYKISETPRQQFLKYMLDLKMTQALYGMNNKRREVEELQEWFDKIQQILRDIYEDPTLTMEFKEETYQFVIHEEGHEPFDFNTASDGFSAVLDIVVGLILRMQTPEHRTVKFDKPGVVLVDEIENHLHLSLQRKVLPFLTDLFPNIQFIVTTHSPFVVNSLDQAVIFDLENKTLVSGGLTDVSYSGVVEGYFNSSELSLELEEKFRQYQKLVQKQNLTDAELAQIAELELYLDEMPDYLMPGIATEYKKMKLEFHNRKDI